jgi:phenylpropionate dioxygenase-like ring-hydroxylating dioxygenase large terminal subunit
MATYGEVRAALEQGATLPYRWYSDAEVLGLERRRLFARSWQYAGRADQVAEPGDSFTCRAGDVPIVVVRDGEGVLRAHVNVCRHRGAEVVSGAARRTTLQCHYHAWTYDLDGGLRAAPRSDGERGFDRSALGLLPARVELWGPFVFVNADADADAPPLAETLGAIPRLLGAGGVDVDALAFHSRAEYGLDANWKVAVENYLECYHCPVAHPGFSDVLDVAPEAYRLESNPTFASHYAPIRERRRDTGYDTDGEVSEGQFHLVWPNLKINVMPGRGNLSIGPLLPVGPERTEGFLDYFFIPDADPAWVQSFLELDSQVGAEDRTLVESAHRGMRSGALESGRLLVSSEHLIGAFQRWVVEGLDG